MQEASLRLKMENYTPVDLIAIGRITNQVQNQTGVYLNLDQHILDLMLFSVV